jgi:hypothetical protein
MIKFADCKGGFPHSEMFGSQGARASPNLIAACHVLHRLSTPRHPSEALMRLIVLSKTHAWGSVYAHRPYEGPGGRPHMRFNILSLQTMMSSRIQPGASFPLGGGRKPVRPFNSRCQIAAASRSWDGNLNSAIARRWLDGGVRRDRTDDLMLAKHALYQLSYDPSSREAG